MATAAKLTAEEFAFGEDVVLTPYGPGNGLPLFIQPTDPVLGADSTAAVAWVEANRPALDNVLLTVGAYVLRGFAVPDTKAFQGMIGSYKTGGLTYVGGASPRGKIDGQVFESTHAPAAAVLAMHQEMSYLPNYPNRVAFYCRMPSVTGGETFLADMRLYTEKLPKDFVEQLRERGVIYTRNFRAPDDSTGHPDLDIFHRTWPDTFSTDDADEAVRRAKAMGMGAEWLPDGSLSITYLATGFATHPDSGAVVSFHQIPSQAITEENVGYRYELYQRFYGKKRPLPYHPTYGDGSEFAPEHLSAMYQLAKDIRIGFPWSHGDVLVLDNFLTGHGRNSFTGNRNIQVALLQ
jgi:alpha-ketoglutarate-dependent taurine dioxygenase